MKAGVLGGGGDHGVAKVLDLLVGGVFGFEAGGALALLLARAAEGVVDVGCAVAAVACGRGWDVVS